MAQNFLDLLGQNLALVNQLRTASAASPLNRQTGGGGGGVQAEGGNQPGAFLPPSSGGGGGGSSSGGTSTGYKGVGPPLTEEDRQWLRDRGFDPNTYGKNVSQPGGGFVVGPGGALVPPGEGGTAPQNTFIQPGELFQAGDTVYRYGANGGITKATAAETRAYLNGDTTGGAGDPYAGAANARAEAALQENIRQNRISEAQAAISNIINRQKLQADTAPWMFPAGTTNFPGFGPNDALQRLHLAPAVPLTPIAFNPNASGNPDQIASDLAALRRAAGVG